MTRVLRSLRLTGFCLLLGALLLSGCGPADGLATVTGQVTLDGEPLPDAYVEFLCEGANAGVSTGKTDSGGNYYLMFSRSKKGARIGPSKVKITTFDLDGTQGGVKRIPEKVPAKFNAQTELTAEVVAGSNVFDFALKSDAGALPKARPEREDL